MRKILSQEDINKKESRNKTIISIVLALILLFSTAGYFVMDFSGAKQEKINYNNIEFARNENGYWDFSIQGQTFMTAYNPSEVANVSLKLPKALGDFAGKVLYFESSSSPIASSEISRNIGNYVARINFACLNEECKDYAIKNCSVDNVIIIKEAENESIIKTDENCVYISYALGEEAKTADAFLFRILGII